jgi:hypothetical protein
MGASKYLLLERREVWPPPPALSPLVDREYHVYERDVNTPEGEWGQRGEGGREGADMGVGGWVGEADRWGAS